MALPINVPDLLRSSSQMTTERDKPLHIVIVVDPDAPDELVNVVRERFRPSTSNVRLQVDVADPSVRVTLRDSTDVVIGVIGTGRTNMAEILADARERAIPSLAIGLAEDVHVVARAAGHPSGDCVASPDAEAVLDDQVADWLVEHLSGKRLALARNFEFVRKAVSEEAVKATAFQNALIGTVVIIPGADMPLMTLNQGKMLLQIAAAYGQPLGAQRVKELAAIIGGGFAFRAVARQLLVLIPGFGWAIKGAVAYGGTMAMGKAAVAYFEEGADLSDVAGRLVEVRDAAMARLRSDRKALKRTADELTAARAAQETGEGPSEL
ncbi:MAG: hypothetical protein RBS78_02380 [Coriobacteriia bacterium]|jgi:uncharacterized protein (DUF697 family)|nr:hypothetical protein [Coriobacteriia bacterium]